MTKLVLEPPVYLIGDYSYSKTSGVVSKNNVLTQLRAKESALLNVLIEHFPNTLSRDQIVKELYEGSYATDATINQLVKRLRKALDDDQRSLIRTIPKQGYMLTTAPQPIEIEPIATHAIHPKYLNCEHGSVNSSEINLEELQRIAAGNIQPNTPNQERLCGAFAVIGGLVALLLGYTFGHFTLYTPNYIERTSEIEFKNAVLADDATTPLASLNAQGDTETIYLVDDGIHIICTYNQVVTTCKTK